MASFNFVTINVNTMTNATKMHALRTFLRTIDADIVFLQEVADPELFIPGYNVIKNVDESRRGTAIALRDHLRYSHVERSLDSRLICARLEGSTTLCNVYAPSGSQRRAEREDFFSRSLAYYLGNATEHVILSGDFNSLLCSKDATGVGGFSLALRNVVNSMDMCDSWEVLRGNEVEYSYITRGSGSRIDRCYISTSLRTELRSTSMHLLSFSDHKALTVRLCLPATPTRPHGNGYWQLRPHVLTTDNLEEFRIKWNVWIRQRSNYGSWIQWWIEFAKPKIKSFFRWKTNQAYSNFRLHHDILYRVLRNAHDRYLAHPNEISNINKIKGKMLSLQKQFSENFSRINETRVGGEPVSSFQLGERRKRRTIIERLTTDEGRAIDDKDEIVSTFRTFFMRLYMMDETVGHEIRTDPSFTCPRSIPEDCEANNDCMEEISVEEILDAIKRSAPRRSPGSDGIPSEFYKRAFDVIQRELALILNEALRGNIPESFVDGIIVPVRKRGGGSTFDSFRPISLLNTDYKLMSRILKRRIENILDKWPTISTSQKCCNKPCNIFQAVLSVKETVVDLKRKRKCGKLISFDLSHAFDRVDRGFLMNTMTSMGFNPRLVSLLEAIGKQSSSKILINGTLSPSFPIQRSVRQGDPLSMHLFLLYLQPLIARLEDVCCDQDDLVVAYADDISVVATSSQKVDSVRGIFDAFGAVSGARLNVAKCSALDIGCTTNTITVPWLRTEERLRLLGILFSNNIREAMTHNWDTVIQRFRHLIWLHRVRHLNLVQRVVLLNTFLLPKLWYVASVCGARAKDIAKVSNLVGSLLWSGAGGLRVPLTQMALSPLRGGLGLQIPAVTAQALLTNRYVTDVCCLKMGAQFVLCAGNPPDLATVPTTYPCLRIVLQQLAYAPGFKDARSSRSLKRLLVIRLPDAKVSRESPGVNWKKVWRNILTSRLPSEQRSMLYLLANAKIAHGELLHRMGRVPNPACSSCPAEDTLEHKFTLCPRVTAAWDLLLRYLRNEAPGCPCTFPCLRFPVLNGVSAGKRSVVLRIFANYIIHIVGNNDSAIDLNVLACALVL